MDDHRSNFEYEFERAYRAAVRDRKLGARVSLAIVVLGAVYLFARIVF